LYDATINWWNKDVYNDPGCCMSIAAGTYFILLHTKHTLSKVEKWKNLRLHSMTVSALPRVFNDNDDDKMNGLSIWTNLITYV